MTWKERFERYKAHYKWTNEDIGRVTGHAPGTVRVLTMKEDTFPRWLKLAIVGFEKDRRLNRKTYAHLSEPQLFELFQMLTAYPESDYTHCTFSHVEDPHDDQNPGIAVTDSTGRRIIFFVESGDFDHQMDGVVEPTYNAFHFFHKCQEFGLTY